MQTTTLFRQTERSVAGLLAYPFNRAHRLEFQGGVHANRVRSDRPHAEGFAADERAVFRRDRGISLNQDVSVVTPSAALVFDTANFGATSPVQGQRYRLSATPAFGTVNYTGVLADYRRYFMPMPFYTLAGRVMHYGRYGADSEDERLYPLYIGYPNLVRGYDVNTFEPDECLAALGNVGSCPAFDRLIGSRMLVANLEFRFPLLRPFGVTQNMYGPIPMEVALFADAGVAWNRGDNPSLFAPAAGATASRASAPPCG